MRVMSSLLTEINESYKGNIPSDYEGQLPKVHLHIDLESVREAEGVTNIQGTNLKSMINKLGDS